VNSLSIWLLILVFPGGKWFLYIKARLSRRDVWYRYEQGTFGLFALILIINLLNDLKEIEGPHRLIPKSFDSKVSKTS
jgi:hypothetical protein